MGQDGGLLAPVNPSAEVRAKIDDFAWDAVTIDGKVYGYPVAVEAISLIYNKDLLPDGAPATFEEMLELDTKFQADGKHAILWAYETPYFTYPLLSAGGGYAFKKNDDGSYDVKRHWRQQRRLQGRRAVPLRHDHQGPHAQGCRLRRRRGQVQQGRRGDDDQWSLGLGQSGQVQHQLRCCTVAEPQWPTRPGIRRRAHRRRQQCQPEQGSGRAVFDRVSADPERSGQGQRR